jgi:uncharacterized protein
VVGASIAIIIQARYAGWSITFAVIAALLLILANTKRLLKEQHQDKPLIKWWHLGLYFLVGVWAGYIILDGNTYALLIPVLAIGYDLKKANAIKAVANLPTSTVSLAIFAYTREVDWSAGLLLSVGSFAGFGLGAVLATRDWIKIWIYRLLVGILLVEIMQLTDKYFYNHIDLLIKIIY